MHQGFENVVEARLGDSPDVATFFLELHTLLERLLRYRCLFCLNGTHTKGLQIAPLQTCAFSDGPFLVVSLPLYQQRCLLSSAQG